MSGNGFVGGGFLAIWSDIAPGDETDYLHWLTREHVTERLSIPGFLSARVYRANLDHPRYLILYFLEDAAVVSSNAYLTRLNNPTSWSQRTMKKLSAFRRGGGTVRYRSRVDTGGVVVPLLDPAQASIDRVETLAVANGVTSVSVLETDRDGTDIATMEKAIRERDESFDRLLLIEALSEQYLTGALALIGHPADRQIGTAYRLVFSQLAASE